MTQVKAKMSFYHDAVGTRANGEVFEVTSEKTVQTLEQQGFVEQVNGQNAEQMQKSQQEQQEVGQKQAEANEAVSKAHFEQNQEANSHTQQIQQMRQQAQQKGQQQEQQGQQQQQEQHGNVAKTSVKKATDK